jgi:hypothetical protein
MVSNPTVPRTTPSGFARHARAAASDLYLPREHWSPRGTWNPDRVVAALKDWTSLTGLPPRSYEWSPGTARALGLTSSRVRLWERQYPRWPSSKTVCTYFGRWSQALRAAGLNAAPPRCPRRRARAACRSRPADDSPGSGHQRHRRDTPDLATNRPRLSTRRELRRLWDAGHHRDALPAVRLPPRRAAESYPSPGARSNPLLD